MTPLSLALRARHFYPFATRRACAVQAIRYARAVAYLGDKWLMAKPSPRLPEPRPV